MIPGHALHFTNLLSLSYAYWVYEYPHDTRIFHRSGRYVITPERERVRASNLQPNSTQTLAEASYRCLSMTSITASQLISLLQYLIFGLVFFILFFFQTSCS